MTDRTPREIIGEWGEIYRWDGGDAKVEALEEADLLIAALENAGYVIVPKNSHGERLDGGKDGKR